MKGKKITILAATLDKVLSSRGLGGRLKEYRVLGKWEKLVGPVVARHARPVSIRGKKLALVVDSSAWMQQLTLLKPELLEKVNQGLGRGSVESITLRLGEVPADPAPRRAERMPAAAPLNEQDRLRIEAVVGEIHDPDVKAALRHLMEKDLGRKKNP